MKNMYLVEAVSDTFNPAGIVSQFKKSLNTCKLSKFKSIGECAAFYSAFFLNTTNDGTTFTVDQWGTIYATLLADSVFTQNLSLYIAMYQPSEYRSMFSTFMSLIPAELETHKNRIRYLSDAKSTIFILQKGMYSVCTTVTTQIHDQNAVKFASIIQSVLDALLLYVNKLISRELLTTPEKENGVMLDVHYSPVSEAAEELIDIFRNTDDIIKDMNECSSIIMNEGIVSKAKELSQAAAVKLKKLEDSFNYKVTRSWQKIRNDRRDRKHSEIVGESLRITNEIRRIMISAPVAIFNPGLAVITWAVTLLIDRKTDQKDRDVMVGQLRDELEILEEKIQIADRKGDDKERIELIRFRQKLQNEYKRISKVSYKKNSF